MDGVASIGGVGAVVNQAQFQVAWGTRVLTEQQAIASDTGSAALNLINAAIGVSATGNDLNITA